MTQNQLKRANKIVFWAMFISFLGNAIATVILSSTVLSFDLSAYIQIAMAVIGIVINTVIMKLRPDAKMTGIIILSTGSIGYFIMMVVGTADYTYIVAFPMLIAAMAYMNLKLMAGGYVLAGLAVIIHSVRSILSGSDNIQNAVVALSSMFLICVVSCLVTIILHNFSREDVEDIQKASKAQEEVSDKIVNVANDVIAQFENANSRLDSLMSAIKTSDSSMDNIAASSESTAEAIQKQAVMCGEIRENTDGAEQQTIRMIQASGRASGSVSDGSEVIQGLREQAKQVEEASTITVEATTRLTTKVDEVRNIVGAILSISNQTNLLALNASIEAARAGEAGKGFAVVAEEIRQLSEQTKNASNKISNIINELITDVERANSSMEISSQSIQKQNEMIEVTKGKFDAIQDEMNELTETINTTDKIMKSIVSSTNIITDNISQLSAASEEVSAASTEGAKVTETAVEEMDEFKKVLDSIYELAVNLKQYAKK